MHLRRLFLLLLMVAALSTITVGGVWASNGLDTDPHGGGVEATEAAKADLSFDAAIGGCVDGNGKDRYFRVG